VGASLAVHNESQERPLPLSEQLVHSERNVSMWQWMTCNTAAERHFIGETYRFTHPMKQFWIFGQFEGEGDLAQTGRST
jgi:hypothetical protein